jgi:hypothetical protein
MDNATLSISKGDQTLYTKRYAHLRPPEMERLRLKLTKEDLNGPSPLLFCLEGKNHA